ncbi:hypothetical protein AVEN_234859-1 [Araneus ventricosus]|uniref:Integrase catalytic domain-containing protein n=1 Tax=Araneus ventricosus TaxID=182803 RepID=A0A4Y2IGC3_ARAVE|nr:hypothetical protein AVEN_234859-1 [Araneus ventricosus]
MGGRLEYSDFSSDEKHPIILPRNSSLTGLILQDEHICMKNGGIVTTLAKIRSRFWIPKGRQIVQKIIRRCLICRRYSAKSADQLTSQLPEDRIAQTPPFYSSGVDFTGPIYVKNLERMQKSYIVLFTCATTRALHLELVPTMTTEFFLMAFRRFIHRRGNCRIMYSDNAKTFKMSNRELEEISKPVQFLNFARSDSTLPINFKEIIAAGSSRPSLIKRKKYQDLLVKQLWSKWKKQYIMDLRNAHALKNPNPQQNIAIDDVVLIKGDNKSKLLWKLGRVIQVFPGRDGGVRSCLLKTSDGTLKRPVQLLYPLEL